MPFPLVWSPLSSGAPFGAPGVGPLRFGRRAAFCVPIGRSAISAAAAFRVDSAGASGGGDSRRLVGDVHRRGVVPLWKGSRMGVVTSTVAARPRTTR
jgi:hypothetical protein